MNREVVLAYAGFEKTARAIAARGAELGEVAMRTFPDGELHVRIDCDVEGAHVTIVCGLDRPDQRFLGLAVLAETARDLGAARVVLVAPYLSYMRQDERFRAGEGVTSHYFARLISVLFDGLVTVDPHLHRISSLDAIYAIPTECVSSSAPVAAWIGAELGDVWVLGPDEESAQWADAVAGALSTDRRAIVLTKDRRGDRDVLVSATGLDRLAGARVVVLDDIISTGRTMVAAIERVREAGAEVVACVGVHAVFSDEGAERIISDAGGGHLVTCDTIAHDTNAIPCDDVIADGWEALLSRL